ncbi:MAG TPA: glycosyltransferase family 2 protein [Gemmatimonadaceae bacterium]|jgi:cellulose synthase/poly-beta-1,6-N-acetylglucosamine synthase-like glycosyltransferase
MLTFAVTAVVAVIWLPLVSELISLVKRRRVVPTSQRSDVELPRLLFLVPAHNEELLIAGCVRSLLGMTYPTAKRRIIVLADNCTDRTALVARELGAESLIRDDLDAPGKPRAIAWALERVALRDWDACVIVDADSTVASNFASALAKLAPLNDIAFQSNIGVLNETESWLTRLGGVLSRCRYEVTYPLKQSAGLNCPINGNGMGFGTNLLIRDGWRAFSIAEDSEQYAIYTEAGVPIRHAGEANLFSQEARSLEQGATQRRRWLAGRIHILREWGVRLLLSPHIGWHQKLDAIVELGLAIPVLHLLIALFTAVIAVTAVGGAAGWWIASLSAASLLGIAANAAFVIARHPQPWRTVLSFFMLPVYAAWRLVVLLGTLSTLRDVAWRKTARTAPGEASEVLRIARPRA